MNTPENKFIFAVLTQKLKSLPALPEAVTAVREETDKADPSPAKVESLVASDQALAGKVLQVVNSAYYGIPSQVSSVGKAIVILGLQQVRSLVLSVGAFGCFEIAQAKYRPVLRQFWIHGFGTGMACRTLAKQKCLDEVSIDALFTAGLLHDVGKLFAFANFPQIYDTILADVEKGAVVEVEERKHFSMDHAQIGRLVAEKWSLPKQLVEWIGNHEGPFTGNEGKEILILHVADCLCKSAYADCLGGKVIADPAALDALKINPEAYIALEVKLKADMAADELAQLIA